MIIVQRLAFLCATFSVAVVALTIAYVLGLSYQSAVRATLPTTVGVVQSVNERGTVEGWHLTNEYCGFSYECLFRRGDDMAGVVTLEGYYDGTRDTMNYSEPVQCEEFAVTGGTPELVVYLKAIANEYKNKYPWLINSSGFPIINLWQVDKDIKDQILKSTANAPVKLRTFLSYSSLGRGEPACSSPFTILELEEIKKKTKG